MSLYLDALTAHDCEDARLWRNHESARMGLRTPYMLTYEMQREFYERVVCDRNSRHRYWAVRAEAQYPVDAQSPDPAPKGALRGMVGLTDIEWENGHAEVSLILAPAARGQGYGSEALTLVLWEAFARMRLATVFAEVFTHNPAVGFWLKAVERLEGGHVRIPRRKMWDGQFHDALLCWFVAPEGGHA